MTPRVGLELFKQVEIIIYLTLLGMVQIGENA
jgi:hypothetical protein